MADAPPAAEIAKRRIVYELGNDIDVFRIRTARRGLAAARSAHRTTAHRLRSQCRCDAHSSNWLSRSARICLQQGFESAIRGADARRLRCYIAGQRARRRPRQSGCRFAANPCATLNAHEASRVRRSAPFPQSASNTECGQRAAAVVFVNYPPHDCKQRLRPSG